MGCSSTKMARDVNCLAMPDPLYAYVPLESLTESVVRSVISVATLKKYWRSDDNSQRTLLAFLLAIDRKLKEIEDRVDTTDKEYDQQIIQQAKNVRQWLVDKHQKPLQWEELQQKYADLTKNASDENADRYHELTAKTWINDVKQSRRYIAKSRNEGFKPEELKIYWNAEQLENLCPKEGEQSGNIPSHDPSDVDAIKNLREFPVQSRQHSGTITYVNKGIEKAVFDVPDDAQIIVLNFANEQSPGGGYLRNARAQEEVMLYNSDGYRSLLDLKYGRMGGGYAIPEFGLAYVRDICFHDSQSDDHCRNADMMVSACYCMNGQELYENPKGLDEWKKNNLAKFRAFMAAAVANTKGNGDNTYLLLGPIGTGAFGNDVNDIAEVFREVLQMPMMNSTKPIRYAFGNIWFVSIDKWKNDDFEKILPANESDNTEKN